jgi:hypothetical protein
VIATSQRVVGTASAVEVQLNADVKVAASVLVADRARDVALLRVDPKTVATVQAVPLDCAPAKPPAVGGQQIFTIAVPLRQAKGMSTGTVNRVEARVIVSDFTLAGDSAGGPVFTAAGDVAGITTVWDDVRERTPGNTPIVPVANLCAVVAEQRVTGAPPAGTHLPVEPPRPSPVDALKEAAQRRGGSLNPYTISSSEFDVAFITPVMIFGAQYLAEQMSARDRGRGTRAPVPMARPVLEFSNWSDYVADLPPVLLVRVTPRLVENFWAKVARGAAQTQGMELPPIKRFTSGFLRMRAFCGDAEVTPIHPFKLERRVSETEAIYEGLYVFDPGALGPQCGTAKLVLHSEKEPAKADTRTVDASVLQQIWRDFEPYRALSGGTTR